MQKRIWELDFFRGVFLWGMIGIHLIYDLVDLYGVIQWEQPAAYLLFKNRFGILFVLLSGLCATLGKTASAGESKSSPAAWSAPWPRWPWSGQAWPAGA